MAKRRRSNSEDSEEEPSVPQKEVIRSDIWLEDGNIVLEAERTQFRAHRGLLARVSPIFSDVFSVPQPAQEDPMVDGCPVLHLQDSAEDVHHLLSALYDQRYHSKEPIPFDTASALLRLGRKYEIRSVFREVLCRLKADIPTTLVAFDDLPDPNYWKEIGYEPGILFKVTELLHLSGFPEVRCILPLAYFWCCGEKMDVIIKGDVEDTGEDLVKVPPLSPEVALVCLAGRQKLIDRFDAVFSWANAVGSYEKCEDPARCSSISKTLMNALWRPEPQLDRMLDSWALLHKTLSNAETDPVIVKKLCNYCYIVAHHRYTTKRAETWRSLPSYFDLPDWDVLYDTAKDAAL
ncbi:hypothetical protein NMY22_g14224 [Coprinellus aureogranulatus]|nr:hypothetical protein NMY22_g14224 [Coprinellus aureogranulatus]